MVFPRILAATCVLLLVGSLSCFCIGAISMTGPAIIHNHNVKHVDGEIVAIGPDMDIVLETATGQYVHFQCSILCHALIGHIQRHLREHAESIVYYVPGPKHIWQALYVD